MFNNDIIEMFCDVYFKIKCGKKFIYNKYMIFLDDTKIVISITQLLEGLEKFVAINVIIKVNAIFTFIEYFSINYI